MLTIHTADGRTADGAGPVTWTGGALPPSAIWLDLMCPDEAERQVVEARTGMPLPPRAEIEGIGLSGRNRAGDDALHLHMALFADRDDQAPAPLGLRLMPDLLISLRYAESRVLTDAAKTLREDGPPTGAGALLALVQTLVEHTAARMQAVAEEMVHLSDRLFVRTRLRTQLLRALMIEVGCLEGRLTRIRASLLGVNRMLVFVREREVAWLDDAARQQLRILSSDVGALDEFDQQLTDKLQFLLDAILGFISTVQNDVMKLLTVVSVATIPPIILVGVWGMNFKHMPELDKPWGYPMALTAILISTLVPLLLFGLRGWLASPWTGPLPRHHTKRH